MRYERKKISKFLNMELCAVTEDFEKKFSAQASYLLNDEEELFAGIFIKFSNGEMIVKFRNTRAFPRKGEYVYSMYLPSSRQDYRLWGNASYEELYKSRLKGSEAVCIWQTKSVEDGYVLLGFRGIDTEFANYIKDTPGALLYFGPHVPPIEYLAHLDSLVKDEISTGVNCILDKEYSNDNSSKLLINSESPSDLIYNRLSENKTIILQGPPGTGKTHLIAQLCSRLCLEGKSVLVTALTNRALIEIASKDAMCSLLSQGKVLKSNLTLDESTELPNLISAKQVLPMPGHTMMATFFITSGVAAVATLDEAFDYVIVDEASQALFPMFAAAKKLGMHNLWVGDIAQLPPIVSLNEDRIKSEGFLPIVNGLSTLTLSGIFPIYQLTLSYRFAPRSAEYSGVFYANTLKSALRVQDIQFPSIRNLVPSGGGPTLLLTDMPTADTVPQFALDIVTYLVGGILTDNKDCEIAILTCLRKTTRALQKAVAVRLGLANKVLIETVARVQGLTTDVAIYVIPNASLIRSLEPHLFNVATSRSRQLTIIVADRSIMDYPLTPIVVRNYLNKLHADKSFYVGGNEMKFKKLST